MTIQTLLVLLSTALPGDTVTITGTINATGYTISIPEGVTLYSNSRALIYSTSFTPVSGGYPLIQTGGPNVTISGIRLRGATGEITDFDYRRGVSKGIHGNHPGLKIINCEIYWFDMWGIYLYCPNGSVIEGNYIHNCRNAGYGYGVWVGGSGSKYEGVSVIRRNIFDACRSAVDGSGHYSDMYIVDNVFLPEQHYTIISRHGQGNGCVGGNNFTATGNILTADQRAFTIPDPATDTGRIMVIGNRVRNSERSLIGCNKPDTTSVSWQNGFTIQINGPSSVKVNTNFTLSATGADSYWWRSGSGGIDQGQRTGNRVTYNFKFPGMYIVTCIGWRGMEPSIAYYSIAVLPDSGTWVSMWSKDSYIGSLTGRFVKSVYANGVNVWTDDVSGYEGWQMILFRCDTIRTLAFELRSPNGCKQSEIQEVFSWWDAVSVVSQSGVIFSDNFEGKVNWKLTTNPIGAGVSTQTPVGERRAGEHCYLIRYALGKDAGMGWGGRLEYKIR